MIATQAALDLQTEELDNNKLLTYSGVEVYSQTEICTPENEYASKELAMRIQRVLDSLPENQRKVVIQYDIEQLPMYVIADNLQLKYGYVRNLYMFARNSINKAIEEYFNDG
jgi:RNA polymerase sigma factor (sigma-70 family)